MALARNLTRTEEAEAFAEDLLGEYHNEKLEKERIVPLVLSRRLSHPGSVIKGSVWRQTFVMRDKWHINIRAISVKLITGRTFRRYPCQT